MNYFALIPPNPPTPKFRIRKLIRGKSSSWENLRGKYTEILMGNTTKIQRFSSYAARVKKTV